MLPGSSFARPLGAIALGTGLIVALMAVGDSQASAAVSAARLTSIVRTLTDPAIIESSGLARSQFSATRLWTHNDSGGGTTIYAIGGSGRTVAKFDLAGASHRDWEGMSNAFINGTNYLYLGDIGDNGSTRSSIFVHRVREPRISRASHVLHPLTWEFRYPDGAHNAETLMVRPGDQRIFIVSKGKGGNGAVYEAPKVLTTKHVNVLHKVGVAPEGMSDGVFLNHRRYLLRGYVSGWLYRRIGATPTRFPLPLKGESVTRGWLRGTVLIGSEGRNSNVWQVKLP